MGNDICFLITILHDGKLLDCAIKVRRDSLPGDCDEHPMEWDNKEYLHNMLPTHVKSCGPIVAVEEIFEVHNYTYPL